MGQTPRNALTKTLTVAAVAELATALALLVDPLLVVRLVLGAELNPVGTVIGRWFGFALIGLCLACWPTPGNGRPAFRAMLAYNALMVLSLVYLGAVARTGGPLLWPAAVFHGGVTLVLALTGRREA